MDRGERRYRERKARIRLDREIWEIYGPMNYERMVRMRKWGTWWMRNPNWWNRMMTTKPARAETRGMLHRLEEEGYPDYKKPEHYFW